MNTQQATLMRHFLSSHNPDQTKQAGARQLPGQGWLLFQPMPPLLPSKNASNCQSAMSCHLACDKMPCGIMSHCNPPLLTQYLILQGETNI
jgi:hypothetical protein